MADDFIINLTPENSTSILGMTNYVIRGISQTGGRPAASVTDTYTLDDGLFASAGIINSNQGNNGFEADFGAGYATKLNDKWSYQASIAYQSYPGASNYGNLSNVEFQNIFNDAETWGTVVAAFAVQPQGQDHAGFYSYTTAGVDFNLPDQFVLGTRAGWNTNSNHAVTPNYLDWTINLQRPITDKLSWRIQYTGSTDHGRDGGNIFVGMLSFTF